MMAVVEKRRLQTWMVVCHIYEVELISLQHSSRGPWLLTKTHPKSAFARLKIDKLDPIYVTLKLEQCPPFDPDPY